jgi:hypothetical protein
MPSLFAGHRERRRQQRQDLAQQCAELAATANAKPPIGAIDLLGDRSRRGPTRSSDLAIRLPGKHQRHDTSLCASESS